MAERHIPVLLNEIIDFIPQSAKVFVDGTVGFGGHTEAILKKFPNLHVIGIDQDEEALSEVKKRLEPYKERISLVKGNFREIDRILKDSGFEKADVILADIGVSSYQLDQAERGFSFREEGPLDMRMDKAQKLKAEDIVNACKEEDLANLIFKYGEERNSRRIARRIVEARKKQRITTTSELREIIGGYKGLRIDPATRTFQALRIEVNDELGALKEFLERSIELLNEKGIIEIISFHSLEDRIVKNYFRDNKERLKILTKKPVTAGEIERKENPRSRSAKLRVAELK